MAEQASKTGGAYGIYDVTGRPEPKSLQEAAERNNVSLISKLVGEPGMDINRKDAFGRTALHWAADCGNIDAAEALMDYGCNVSVTDMAGRTAVHLASRGGYAELLRSLVKDLPEQQRIELVNQIDCNGVTPVYLALQKGEEGKECFEVLMQFGAKYNNVNIKAH